MHLISLRAATLSLGLMWGEVAAFAQPPVELFTLVQSELRRGASIGLIVERGDLQKTAGVASSADGDGLGLQRLQAAGSEWTISQGTVPRVSRRRRPRDVDQMLATQVRVQERTLSVGRAIFIVPRAAVHGTLTGVAGGGVTSAVCRLDREIRVDDRTRPLGQFLDDVVGQAPSVAWVLTWEAESPRKTLSLGVMCPDGSMSLLSLSVSG